MGKSKAKADKKKSVDQQWFNVSQAARYLGMGHKYVRARINEGLIQAYLPEGKAWKVYRREDLDALMSMVR